MALTVIEVVLGLVEGKRVFYLVKKVGKKGVVTKWDNITCYVQNTLIQGDRCLRRTVLQLCYHYHLFSRGQGDGHRQPHQCRRPYL